MGLRDRFKFLLWYPERCSASAQRCVAFQALHDTLSANAVGKLANRLVLRKIPSAHDLSGAAAEQFVLSARFQRCRLGAYKLSFRLRHQPRGKLQELLSIF